MKRTTVIGLLGGPGLGKSTTSEQVSTSLKQIPRKCELVQEYVKGWAWSGRHVGEFDQPLIMGKQMHKESQLYGKVEFVVTDSPFILSAFYHHLYGGHTYLYDAVRGFKKQAERNGVDFRFYFINRQKAYQEDGRFQTEDEAKMIDARMGQWLDDFGIEYLMVSGDPRIAAQEIIGNTLHGEKI